MKVELNPVFKEFNFNSFYRRKGENMELNQRLDQELTAEQKIKFQKY